MSSGNPPPKRPGGEGESDTERDTKKPRPTKDLTPPSSDGGDASAASSSQPCAEATAPTATAPTVAAAAPTVATATAPAAPADGEPSVESYSTADEAAKAALNEANPRSIADNTERGGLIYRNPDGTFGYTQSASGTGASFDPSSVSAPPSSSVVGDYHTHGDYSTAGPAPDRKPFRTSDPSKDEFKSDQFSRSDLEGITSDAKNKPGYTGYLGTPSGDMLKFTPDSNARPSKF